MHPDDQRKILAVARQIQIELLARVPVRNIGQVAMYCRAYWQLGSARVLWLLLVHDCSLIPQ